MFNVSLDNVVFCCMCVCLCTLCVLQHCKIYLCGTKNDLVEADRSLRQIDFHDAQDFAEGNHSLTVMNLPQIYLTGSLCFN